MKKVTVSFDYNGNTVTAKGKVWDSLFVDDMKIKIRDENDEMVFVTTKEFNTVRELAEENIVDKYTNIEVEF